MLGRLSMLSCFSAVLFVFAAAGSDAASPPTDRAGLDYFEKRIRPVLVQSCYECHSGTSAEPKGGLLLDSRAGVLKGGESGASIVPGRPDDSLLMDALRYESLQMPPKNQLPKEVIADFARWIEMGAPDPRDQPDATPKDDAWQSILAARRDWWSLQPVVDPPLPANGTGWAKRDLDRFISRKLEEAGLTPGPPADASTLIRRLSLVLTGLPPKWEDVERFQRSFAMDPDAAYESLVDRLLASPHFGECWARHWMDVVRFSETHGNEWNYELHHAWRYRDYLIRAFNADVPYDRFVREHIAGDLIEPRWNEEQQLNEAVIGTSFYRFGEVNHDDCVTLTSIGYDILDNQIDTLTKAFQATTAACARCHHHKLDAVSMDDYYALLGILKSSRMTAHTIDAESVNAEAIERLRDLKPLIRTEIARHWQMQLQDVSRSLLAADAHLREADDAQALAEGLDPDQLERWIATLKVEDAGFDHPARAWQQAAADDPAAKWRELAAEYAAARDAHAKFNAERFVPFGQCQPEGEDDASSPRIVTWGASGQGLRGGPSGSGEFTIAQEGEFVVASVLPAGLFTHVTSQKLNGTLRSPALPPKRKFISVLVLGEKTSAFRLVSNNCQLNYANYHALISAKPTWVTIAIPETGQALNTFAELVTKFDNPKFPDQLGTLGGDKTNDRIPWSEAAADPRSYFGILQAVLHNQPEPPKPDLAPLARLFTTADEVTSREEIADHYTEAIRRAVSAWAEGNTTDDDVYWLSWVVEYGLLDHSVTASPRLSELIAEYRRIERELKQPRLSPGMADSVGHDGNDHPLFERGDYHQPGRPVPRRYLEVLASQTRETDEASFPQGSGRRQLADEIASPRNPLTARVMVNRVWHHLFGTGLVSTVDDFGHVGERPSHPELLDYLAARFVQPQDQGGMGWSLKSLIREIVLSQTFRMSNRDAKPGRTTDPQNRLLHHYPARRMEAEAIRDSILATSRRLDRALFGMSIQPFRDEPNAYRRLFPGPLDGDGRRSVYIKTNLMEGPAFLSSFNLPGGKITQGRRDVTNVPAQALTLLNDRFVLQQAGVWGERVAASNEDRVSGRIAMMLRDALGRAPATAEAVAYEELVESLAHLHEVPPNEVLSSQPVWQDVAHVIFNLKEFIFIP